MVCCWRRSQTANLALPISDDLQYWFIIVTEVYGLIGHWGWLCLVPSSAILEYLLPFFLECVCFSHAILQYLPSFLWLSFSVMHSANTINACFGICWPACSCVCLLISLSVCTKTAKLLIRNCWSCMLWWTR